MFGFIHILALPIVDDLSSYLINNSLLLQLIVIIFHLPRKQKRMGSTHPTLTLTAIIMNF